MPRITLRGAALTALVSLWTAGAVEVQAQGPGAGRGPVMFASQNAPQRLPQAPARPISQNAAVPAYPGYHAAGAPGYAAPGYYAPGAPGAPVPGAAPAGVPGHAVLPGYPYLNAPLSPTPRPNIPYQVGGTVITNQALSPHEMLYPHKYKALYPPFYHKVRGHWVVTPFGVWSYDNWELQGTEVRVNYRDHISPLSFFHPPVLH